MDKTINFTLSTSGVSGTNTVNTVDIQSPCITTFNFNGITESTFNVERISIDYGDGSEILWRSSDIIRTYLDTDQLIQIMATGIVNSALSSVVHTYYATSTAFFTPLTAIVSIWYTNFAKYTINVPIRVAKSSYYNTYESFSIKTTQLIDVSGNNILVSLQSKAGDLYNVVLTHPL